MISGAQSQIFKVNLYAQEAKFPVWISDLICTDVISLKLFLHLLFLAIDQVYNYKIPKGLCQAVCENEAITSKLKGVGGVNNFSWRPWPLFLYRSREETNFSLDLCLKCARTVK